ncbi:MAG: putative sugar O-methyltransferase [Alphaproteobacteria bacterium]|nr:putative sugar O-methyltransferase [Alphaproteobacteria bacterium]
MSGNILEICRKNYARAIELDRQSVPGQEKRWDKYRVTLNKVIESVKNERDAIFKAQYKTFDSRRPIGTLSKIFRCDVIRYPGRLLKIFIPEILIIYLYERVLKHSFPHFSKKIDDFSDVSVSWKETLLRVKGGRILSNVLFWHAYHILACASYINDRKIKSVCEIGGGYGNIARLWFENTVVDIDTYLIIDIPESLFFADVFLRSTLKDVEVVYINSVDDIDKANDAKKVVYLCPIYLHELTSSLKFDVITNTESIPEMGDDWIHFWKDWLSSQNAPYFYSHNFAISKEPFMPAREEFISPLVPPNGKRVSLR